MKINNTGGDLANGVSVLGDNSGPGSKSEFKTIHEKTSEINT